MRRPLPPFPRLLCMHAPIYPKISLMAGPADHMSSNPYSTRLATPNDFAGVGLLLRASYPTLMASAYEPAILEPALELMARANPGLLASGTYYVAEVGDLIAGCGGWTREYPGRTDVQPELAHLRHFGTHPQWTQ